MFWLLVPLLSMNLYAAKKQDFWYKVEPTEKKKEIKKPPEYVFDSMENNAKTQKLGLSPLWALGSKISLGGGFLYDRPYQKAVHSKPFVLLGDVTFRDRSWHRLRMGGALTFHSQFITFASWDWTPSRKSTRAFYGMGLGIVIDPKDEIRNFLTFKHYLLAPSAGLEFLLDKHRGLRVELKGLFGTNTIGALATVAYMWSL